MIRKDGLLNDVTKRDEFDLLIKVYPEGKVSPILDTFRVGMFMILVLVVLLPIWSNFVSSLVYADVLFV